MNYISSSAKGWHQPSSASLLDALVGFSWLHSGGHTAIDATTQIVCYKTCALGKCEYKMDTFIFFHKTQNNFGTYFSVFN
jgi:hypothetical protein